jgi:hypothetical protein
VGLKGRIFPIIPSEEENPRLLLDNAAPSQFCQLRSAGLSRRRSELTFLRLLPERAFTFERGAEEFAKSYRINLRLLPELAFSSEHDVFPCGIHQGLRI